MARSAAPGGDEALRYSRGAIWLHWIIAALIAANLVIGFGHDDWDDERLAMLVHKSIGVSVLGLSLLRLAWRVLQPPPPHDPAMGRWEGRLAGLVHWLFYALMILMPLSGWALASTDGPGVDWFGLVDLGRLPLPAVEDVDDIEDGAEELHEALARLMIALILLHVAGAAKHLVQGHPQIMARMAPWRGRR